MPREKCKTEIVTMRMTPYTKKLLQEKAREANMTLTMYLCICGLGQQIVRVEGLDKVLHELKAQGRNLNQLTTLANMGKLNVLRGGDLVNGYAKLTAQVSELAKAVNAAPTKAIHSFCGERRHPGMNELSAEHGSQKGLTRYRCKNCKSTYTLTTEAFMDGTNWTWDVWVKLLQMTTTTMSIKKMTSVQTIRYERQSRTAEGHRVVITYQCGLGI